MSKEKVISIIVFFIILFNIIATFINQVYASSKTYIQYVKSGIESFPESYRSYLTALKEAHPNWNFEAYYTGISWAELVEKESVVGKNRVIKSADPLWINTEGSIESGYACASESIIKYYMDPRNFLKNDVLVFQFLEMTYNANVQNKDGVISILKNTFMNGTVNIPDKGEMSYAQIIMEAAQASNMSPYSIAIKIIQEVGSSGSSSVSGTYAGYEGYYNFFNYGANDEGNAIKNGLEYAKSHGWSNQYTAIVEGAKLLADNYTNAGQNTAYFYKWDVVGEKVIKAGQSDIITSNCLFNHQYMTNVQDPTGQTSRLYNTYLSNDIIDAKLNFIIPVYENMGTLNKLPTSLTEADGNLYYSVGTDINVRSGPSTSHSTIGTINVIDEVVAVLARKETTDSSGMSWDKVKLSNGIIGYVASKYLEPCNVEDETPSKEPAIATAKVKLTDGSLRMRETPSTSGILVTTLDNGEEVEILQKDVTEADGYIWYKIRYETYTGYVAKTYLTDIVNINNNSGTNVDNSSQNTGDTGDNTVKAKIIEKDVIAVPNLTISELAKELKIEQYSVMKDEKAMESTENLGTGYILKDLKNQIDYTIIVKGDVNGDGEVDVVDLALEKRDISGKAKLSGIYKQAGIIQSDGKEIDVVDLALLKRQVSNKQSITI